MEVCAANPPLPLAFSWTVPLPESSRNSPIEPRAPEPAPVPYRTQELARLQPPSWTVRPVLPAPWPLKVTVSPAPPCKMMLSCAGQSAATIANVNAATITEVGPRAGIRNCMDVSPWSQSRTQSMGSRGPAAAPPRGTNAAQAISVALRRRRRRQAPSTSSPAPIRARELGSGVGEMEPAPEADSVEARERLVPTRVETLTLVGNCTSRLNTPPLVVKTLASNPPVRLRLAARLVLNSPLLEPLAWVKFNKFSAPLSRVPFDHWPI